MTEGSKRYIDVVTQRAIPGTGQPRVKGTLHGEWGHGVADAACALREVTIAAAGRMAEGGGARTMSSSCSTPARAPHRKGSRRLTMEAGSASFPKSEPSAMTGRLNTTCKVVWRWRGAELCARQPSCAVSRDGAGAWRRVLRDSRWRRATHAAYCDTQREGSPADHIDLLGLVAQQLTGCCQDDRQREDILQECRLCGANQQTQNHHCGMHHNRYDNGAPHLVTEPSSRRGPRRQDFNGKPLR